jgi:protein-disulfide isomerase
LYFSVRLALPVIAAVCLGAAGAPPPAGVTLGRAEAPITVVEYGSLTCPHCAAFEQEVLPHLKSDWIETGKIRFVFRDLPRDRNDLLAFQFAHCSGNDRFWGVLDSLYRSQRAWVSAANPATTFIQIGRTGGLGEAKIRGCLADQSLAKTSIASAQAGHEAGVNATPTFFVDGRKVSPVTYEDWQQLLGADQGHP